MQNENFELEFKNRLSKQIRKHRQNKNLSLFDVAKELNVSYRTYQRWESFGDCLTNIFNLLNVFQALDFSTTEIIDVLGLPPLTSNEVKAIYQDEDILKSINDSAIYSAMREKCPDINDFILGKLLELLLKEHLKRLESRHVNP